MHDARHVNSAGQSREHARVTMNRSVFRVAERRCAAPSLRPTGNVHAMRSLPDIERDLIRNAYVDARESLTMGARELGIPRTTLRERLKRYGLR